MTNYNFCLEMQDLCQRAAVAFKTVKKHDTLLVMVYKSAADGFHQRGEKLSAGKADEELSKNLYERFKRFKKWIEGIEKEAEQG